MSQRPRPTVDGPVVDGPAALVNGGGVAAGHSEVAMEWGLSDVGEPLAPTTTITTVAVQAGKAKIVLAILKVRQSSVVRRMYAVRFVVNSPTRLDDLTFSGADK